MDLILFLSIVSIIQFAFFSLQFLMYRDYKYPFLKVLVMSIPFVGILTSLSVFVLSKISKGENKIAKKYYDWFFVEK